MSIGSNSETVAVVCDERGSSAPTMRAWLDAHDVVAEHWFDPLDLDDLDQAVREGRFQRVVFKDLAALLDGIWDGEITFENWLRAGVRLEFVESPDGASESTINAVFASWQRWNRRHRRRQVVAGVVISAIVLVTAFVLNGLRPQ